MSGNPPQVGVRCTDAQRTRWQKAADVERRKLSDWIRIVLDDAADRALESAPAKPPRPKR